MSLLWQDGKKTLSDFISNKKPLHRNAAETTTITKLEEFNIGIIIICQVCYIRQEILQENMMILFGMEN